MANFTRFAFRTSIKSFLDNWFPNKKDDHRTYWSKNVWHFSHLVYTNLNVDLPVDWMDSTTQN